MPATRPVELTLQEHRQLRELYRNGDGEEQRRALVILQANQGRTDAEVAAMSDSSPRYVWKWRKVWLEYRDVNRLRVRGRGRPLTLPPDHHAAPITRFLTHAPPGDRWTISSMAEAVGVDDNVVRRSWKSVGLSPKEIGPEPGDRILDAEAWRLVAMLVSAHVRAVAVDVMDLDVRRLRTHPSGRVTLFGKFETAVASEQDVAAWVSRIKGQRRLGFVQVLTDVDAGVLGTVPPVTHTVSPSAWPSLAVAACRGTANPAAVDDLVCRARSAAEGAPLPLTLTWVVATHRPRS